MGCYGDKYTCNNKQEDGRFTKERLYRMVVNQQWGEMFHSHKVEVLPARISDHRPLFIKADEASSTRLRRS